MRTHLPMLGLLASLSFSSGTALAFEPNPDWPQWRGPHGDACAVGGPYPVHFDPQQQCRWQVALPGIGCSTPIVSGDQIILTCPINGQNAVLSYNFQGKLNWQTVLGAQRRGKHRNGSGCNPSPVSDGQRVFVYFKSGTLAALDRQGQRLWQTNLQDQFGKDTLYWDLGSSPVLTQDNVVVTVLHDGPSYIVALDKQTGKVRWKVDRTYQTPRECDHCYATPVVHTQKGQEIILTWGAEHLTAHQAKTGKLLWECGGFNPDRIELWPVCASLVVAGDMAVIPYGRGTRLTGVKLGGQGDVTDSHRAWVTLDNGCFVPTPAVRDGKLFVLRDRGQVVCLEAKTGKTRWSERFPRGRGKYYASPVLADGKLYAVREDGVVMVAQIDGGWKLLAENELGERVIATPVLVKGQLLIRGENHLFCFGHPAAR